MREWVIPGILGGLCKAAQSEPSHKARATRQGGSCTDSTLPADYIPLYSSSREYARERLKIFCDCLGTLRESGCSHGAMDAAGAGSAVQVGSLSCHRLQNTKPWVRRIANGTASVPRTNP